MFPKRSVFRVAVLGDGVYLEEIELSGSSRDTEVSALRRN